MAITLTDFNKIWASTSPLTPYSFSESNYKQGWNFIGSTPPARQMWDFLQKQNDEKMQYLANNYLPLGGGTMTGAIITNVGESFRRDINTSYLRIMGGDSSTNGSYLALFGKDNSSQAGEFILRARDGSSLVDLYGKPDGTLTWGGKKITVNSNIEDVTITADSTNVASVGGRSRCYRSGCVVTYGANLQIKAGVGAGPTLVTGLPKQSANVTCGLVSDTHMLRCYITSDGKLVTETANTTLEWFNGCITYITTD